MAYEKMADLGTDTVSALGGTNSKTGKPNPSQVEGYYLGARSVVTSTGASVIHVFQTPKGNEGVWGTKKLNDNLTRTVVGKMVLVKYKGKIKITGGKTQHTYEFFIDKSNAIEVDTLPEGNSIVEDEDMTDTDDSTDNTDDEDAAQTAALVAAERQAKVQALLNKNKSK